MSDCCHLPVRHRVRFAASAPCWRSSTEDWLVHPWGARPRGNGSQSEPTGHRLTLTTVVHAGLSVVCLRFNSPLAHVSGWPRVLGSGASAVSDRLAWRTIGFQVFGCRRRVGVALLDARTGWSQSPKSVRPRPAITSASLVCGLCGGRGRPNVTSRAPWRATAARLAVAASVREPSTLLGSCPAHAATGWSKVVTTVFLGSRLVTWRRARRGRRCGPRTTWPARQSGRAGR